MERLSTHLPTKPSSLEDEAFWKHHIERQKDSGLNRKDYCRIHEVNYARFGYWVGKCNTPSSFVAVKLKPPTSLIPETLCTLSLRGGNHLKIHDAQALSMILEKLCLCF